MEAIDRLYQSNTFAKIEDPQTGLYYQGAVYVFEYLKEEINRKMWINSYVMWRCISVFVIFCFCGISILHSGWNNYHFVKLYIGAARIAYFCPKRILVANTRVLRRLRGISDWYCGLYRICNLQNEGILRLRNGVVGVIAVPENLILLSNMEMRLAFSQMRLTYSEKQVAFIPTVSRIWKNVRRIFGYSMPNCCKGVPKVGNGGANVSCRDLQFASCGDS